MVTSGLPDACRTDALGGYLAGRSYPLSLFIFGWCSISAASLIFLWQVLDSVLSALPLWSCVFSYLCVLPLLYYFLLCVISPCKLMFCFPYVCFISAGYLTYTRHFWWFLFLSLGCTSKDLRVLNGFCGTRSIFHVVLVKEMDRCRFLGRSTGLVYGRPILGDLVLALMVLFSLLSFLLCLCFEPPSW